MLIHCFFQIKYRCDIKTILRYLDIQLKQQIEPQGVTYEWSDDKTGSERPEGIQYGFTAQNIQEVFPTLVEEDNLGYLQTAYGTYDAMTVEAIRALYEEIQRLKTLEEMCRQLSAENAILKEQMRTQSAQLDKIAAALTGMGVEPK